MKSGFFALVVCYVTAVTAFALSDGIDEKIDLSALSGDLFVEVDMLTAVRTLRDISHFPICFEETVFDRNTDELTNKTAISDIESIEKVRALTKEEQFKLATYKKQVAAGKVQPIGVKRPRFSVQFSGNTLKDILDSVTSASGNYKWLISNGKILILPKNSILSWKASLLLPNRIEAIEAIQKSDFQSHNIGRSVQIDAGPTDPDAKTKVEVGPLNVVDVPAYELLTRITDSIGPNTYWVLSGYKTMAFFDIRSLQLNASEGN